MYYFFVLFPWFEVGVEFFLCSDEFVFSAIFVYEHGVYFFDAFGVDKKEVVGFKVECKV